MRPSGYDKNGNCTFAIPLCHEFSNKDECIRIIGKYIDKCLERLPNLHFGPENIKNVEDIKKMIGQFYDIGKESLDYDSYVIHHKGISFCLFRHTIQNGWEHSIEFCRYDEMEYIISQQVLYTTLISETISGDEKHLCDHKYDQKMFSKCGTRCTMYTIPTGSTVYVEQKKEHIPKPKKEVSPKPKKEVSPKPKKNENSQVLQIKCSFGRNLVLSKK